MTGLDARDHRGHIAIHERTGALLRRAETAVEPCALTPRSLVARGEHGELVLIDRKTLTPRTTSATWSRPPAVARDVIYAPTGDGVTAVDEATGEMLWTLRADEIRGHEGAALAPLGSRVFGLTDEGRVFCVAEDDR